MPVRLGFKQLFFLNRPDYIVQVLNDPDLFPKFLKSYGKELTFLLYLNFHLL